MVKYILKKYKMGLVFPGETCDIAFISMHIFSLIGFQLRWYGKPCNIFKDDRILKMITTTVLNISKSITFAPKMHL